MKKKSSESKEQNLKRQNFIKNKQIIITALVVLFLIILVIIFKDYFFLTTPAEQEEPKKIVAFDKSHGIISKFESFFSNFDDANLKVEYITSEINQENLKNIDTLIVTIHQTDYLASEIEAIKNFLENRGNLVILGDINLLEDINSLLDLVDNSSVKVYTCVVPWEGIPILNHTLTKEVIKLSFPASGCLEIKKNSNFKIIAVSEAYPEKAIVAVYEKSNKVLISADSNVCDDQYIGRAHNRIFCKNIVSWLSK